MRALNRQGRGGAAEGARDGERRECKRRNEIHVAL